MELKDMPACPVEVTLSMIGEKWKVLIIRELLNGTKRFGQLKKNSGKYFSESFDYKFKANGRRRFDFKKSLCGIPPRVEYTLSVWDTVLPLC